MARKHNNKGRSINTDRFTRLHSYMTKSAAWKSLDAYERCTFIAIKQRYNGLNNGAMSMSIREICDEIGCRDQRAQKSLKTLIERGFIDPTEKGSFHRKTRHDGSRGSLATKWRVTDESQDLPERVLGGATKEFMKWRPDDDPNGTKKKKTTVVTKTTNDSDKNYHKNKMVVTKTTNDSDKNYHNSNSVTINDSDEHYTYNIPYTPPKIINHTGD